MEAERGILTEEIILQVLAGALGIFTAHAKDFVPAADRTLYGRKFAARLLVTNLTD
jgi:hypothetical protein